MYKASKPKRTRRVGDAMTQLQHTHTQPAVGESAGQRDESEEKRKNIEVEKRGVRDKGERREVAPHNKEIDGSHWGP